MMTTTEKTKVLRSAAIEAIYHAIPGCTIDDLSLVLEREEAPAYAALFLFQDQLMVLTTILNTDEEVLQVGVTQGQILSA